MIWSVCLSGVHLINFFWATSEWHWISSSLFNTPDSSDHQFKLSISFNSARNKRAVMDELLKSHNIWVRVDSVVVVLESLHELFFYLLLSTLIGSYVRMICWIIAWNYLVISNLTSLIDINLLENSDNDLLSVLTQWALNCFNKFLVWNLIISILVKSSE